MTSNAVVTQPSNAVPSVIARVASSWGMDRRAFEATLMKTVMPSAVAPEHVVAFLLVAERYGLNPIVKEIHAFPDKKGGITPVVGIDGWITLMNRNAAFDGVDFEDHADSEGQIAAITCRIYRKDRAHPVAVREYMDECKRGTEPWKQWPARMLRHKALIQCARIAFGFAGIYDEDEAARIVDAQLVGGAPDIEPQPKGAVARLKQMHARPPAPPAPPADDLPAADEPPAGDESPASPEAETPAEQSATS